MQFLLRLSRAEKTSALSGRTFKPAADDEDWQFAAKDLVVGESFDFFIFPLDAHVFSICVYVFVMRSFFLRIFPFTHHALGF